MTKKAQQFPASPMDADQAKHFVMSQIGAIGGRRVWERMSDAQREDMIDAMMARHWMDAIMTVGSITITKETVSDFRASIKSAIEKAYP